MPFVRTETGVTAQTFDEIREELRAAYTNPATGMPDLDTSDESLLGRILSIDAQREADLQQQILAVLADTDPNTATGVALIRLATITGTIARDATYSTVTLSVTISAPLPAGARVSDSSGNTIFETTATINTSGSVQARSIVPGNIIAPANTLTRKVSSPGSMASWATVTNPTAAIPGENAETDGELRIRRARELNQAASANITAITTAVESVPNVIDVGYVNDTDIHEYEIVVYGPSADSDAIAQAIWDNGPAGIASRTHGGTPDSGTAVDSDGVSHTIDFTRATQVPIYVHVYLTKDPTEYPVDGDTQVDNVVSAAIGNITGKVGQDVIQSRLYSSVYSVPGVIDVTDLFIGTSPGPTLPNNITIAYDSVAVAADVTTTSVDA